MKFYPKSNWSLTDPKPYRGEDPGEAMARKAGEEQPSAVMGLCDALRALARRIEDEGVSHHTVDQLQALKDESEDLL